ncbi:hypothetical protein BY996DRAFT_6409551 [Phakopsora pachyrhizi]|nr:hypothetical protein BY996DRAFT_6409551 [Phakopsora pachyrhizi]
MSAHGAAATNSRVYLPTNCSATLKVLKSSESAVGFQAVTVSNKQHFPVAYSLAPCHVQFGTIVDKVIGDPFNSNLLLKSQASLNSTSYPTRYVVQMDETNNTVDDPQNIANSVSTPTYYAYLVATRAKKWDISDENGSAVFTTNSGTQTSAASCQENVFKNNKPEGSSGKNNALLPDVFSWEKNSQPPEEYSKRKFTLPSLNNMIARVKCCKCTKNEDDKIYPLQPPRVPSIFNGTIHYG